MNRRLTTLPGMGGIVGTRSGHPPCARVAGRCTAGADALTTASPPARRPGHPAGYAAPVNERRAPHPANDLNELSGEEWLYFTKSVWTTAYPSELGHAAAQGARREQAAAADGPPDRVLHRSRRARARPVRGRRRDAARRGDRPRAAAGARHRARRRAGPTVYARGRRRALQRRARRRGAARWPTSAPTDPGGPRGFDPSGCELRVGDALDGPADARGRRRSTSSPPTRRTTSSCR